MESRDGTGQHSFHYWPSFPAQTKGSEQKFSHCEATSLEYATSHVILPMDTVERLN